MTSDLRIKPVLQTAFRVLFPSIPIAFLQSLTMKVPKEGFPGFPKGLDDDCDRPACDDTVSALKSAMDRFQSRRSSPPVASSPTKSKQEDIVECPPTSPELGRASWALLHSMVRSRLKRGANLACMSVDLHALTYSHLYSTYVSPGCLVSRYSNR
jgi:hypothetical protein